ncbi:MAG: site-2 protease family protein, partial [Candidatus Cloacimonadaceae bacterium]|nr:site-2 protease family protein [Candidatus Cloacimonadaceae bacterium]
MKVKVEKFSIGFGSALVHFERGGVEYRIGWIPFGGYVKMQGENPDEDDTGEDHSFQNQPWWTKALIAVSGPLANLILGLVLIFIAYALPRQMEDHYPVVAVVESHWESIVSPGDSIATVNEEPVMGWYQALSYLKQDADNQIELHRNKEVLFITIPADSLVSFFQSVQPVVPAIVGDLQTGMPAWKAGLKSGDEIVSIDSIEVSDWYQMRKIIVGSEKDTIDLTFKRENTTYSRTMTLEQGFVTDGQPMIGITQYMPVRYHHQPKIAHAFRTSLYATSSFISFTYKGLIHLVQKPEELKSSIGSPLMIVSFSQQA